MLGGVPALRHEAIETRRRRAHIYYYPEWPAGSRSLWSLTLDNLGDEYDPQFETVIESFEFIA